ncbi:MAG: hypothetical protein CSA81_00005, partial [Acidobacteria bacterium]
AISRAYSCAILLVDWESQNSIYQFGNEWDLELAIPPDTDVFSMKILDIMAMMKKTKPQNVDTSSLGKKYKGHLATNDCTGKFQVTGSIVTCHTNAEGTLVVISLEKRTFDKNCTLYQRIEGGPDFFVLLQINSSGEIVRTKVVNGFS